MLKEAIEKILELAPVQIFDVEGKPYSTQKLVYIPPVVNRPERLKVNGLDSVVKLIRTELDKIGTTVLVRVTSETRVEVMTTYLGDYSRNQLYVAETDVPGFRDGWRDRETALIQLRSLFIPGEGTEYLLDLLSKVSKDDKVDTTDNGVTQTVEARMGIALKENVEIRPRVPLQPFRTFLEVAQPESEFLLRLDDEGKVGLYEADGGVWRLEAKRNIQNWLTAQLGDLIKAGTVVVMM